MWFLLLIPSVALLLFLLMRIPVQVRFFARLSLGASRLRIRLRILGVIRIHLTLRLHLFDEPYFTILYFDSRGAIRPIPLFGPTKKKTDWRSHITLKQVHATYFVGLPDDAAATAFLAGALTAAGDYALGRLFRHVSSTPRPVFDRELLRINLEGIASLIPAKSIPILLTKKARET